MNRSNNIEGFKEYVKYLLELRLMVKANISDMYALSEETYQDELDVETQKIAEKYNVPNPSRWVSVFYRDCKGIMYKIAFTIEEFTENWLLTVVTKNTDIILANGDFY